MRTQVLLQPIRLVQALQLASHSSSAPAAVIQQLQCYSSGNSGPEAGTPSTSQPAEQHTAPQAGNNPDAELDTTIEDLRSTPGWLKGPVGRRVVQALGEEEWQPALHPKTNEPCWRSIKTGVFTVPGLPKPDTWTEVVDKQTGLLYYWNRRTGETTDLGEPRPGPEGRQHKSSSSQAEQPTVFDEQQDDSSKKRRTRESRNDDISLLEMLNTPSGYAFVGFTLLACAWPYVTSWMSSDSGGGV